MRFLCRRLVAVALIVGALLLLLTCVATAAEDDPGWDCRTAGNGQCGPAQIGFRFNPDAELDASQVTDCRPDPTGCPINGNVHRPRLLGYADYYYARPGVTAAGVALILSAALFAWLITCEKGRVR